MTRTPPGFHQHTPCRFVRDADSFVRFLIDGLGAEHILCTRRPDGCIAKAPLRLDDSMLMVNEAGASYRPRPASCYLFVEDADAAMARALAH